MGSEALYQGLGFVRLRDDSLIPVALSDDAAKGRTNVDWQETATEHVFKADLQLPRVRLEDERVDGNVRDHEYVRVDVNKHRILSISGQRNREEVRWTDTWQQVDHSSGLFMHKVRLPENANLNSITSRVDNGVLTVVVPKVEVTTPQTPLTIVDITHDDKRAMGSTIEL